MRNFKHLTTDKEYSYIKSYFLIKPALTISQICALTKRSRVTVERVNATNTLSEYKQLAREQNIKYKKSNVTVQLPLMPKPEINAYDVVERLKKVEELATSIRLDLQTLLTT